MIVAGSRTLIPQESWQKLEMFVAGRITLKPLSKLKHWPSVVVAINEGGFTVSYHSISLNTLDVIYHNYWQTQEKFKKLNYNLKTRRGWKAFKLIISSTS